MPGVGKQQRRRSFFTWRENGAVPAVVFEIASQSTWRKDLTGKRRMYERRGVREYFIFDPENLYLDGGPLLGFRHDGILYRGLDPVDGRLSSDLGFDMRPEREMLRLIDRATGRPIPTPGESMERSEQLEAENERLKALLSSHGAAP